MTKSIGNPGKLIMVLSLLSGSVFLVQTAQAASFTYNTLAGSTTSGGSVNAQAIFTPGSGTLTLMLNNYLQTPTDIAQAISAITFNVSGATGSGLLTTTNSGLISTISSSGAYTAGVVDPLTRWKATETGTLIDLTTLTGGAPNSLILGPDSAGGFTQTGLYSNANKSITGNHNPNVLGSATFILTVPGVTGASTLSNVMFQFGSTADSNLVAGSLVSSDSNVPVPEPPSILLLCTGLGFLGLAAWHKKK